MSQHREWGRITPLVLLQSIKRTKERSGFIISHPMDPGADMVKKLKETSPFLQ